MGYFVLTSSISSLFYSNLFMIKKSANIYTEKTPDPSANAVQSKLFVTFFIQECSLISPRPSENGYPALFYKQTQ